MSAVAADMEGIDIEQVGRALGLYPRAVRSRVELHERIAEGFPRRAALHFVSDLEQIPLEESLHALNVSRRSWQRFKIEPGKLLDVDQSSRVWNMAEILTRAESVLGSREEAESWMLRAAIGLDGRRPIDLMSTPQGADLVRTLLERMEFGVYA